MFRVDYFYTYRLESSSYCTAHNFPFSKSQKQDNTTPLTITKLINKTSINKLFQNHTVLLFVNVQKLNGNWL